jgi:hypothetical protein
MPRARAEIHRRKAPGIDMNRTDRWVDRRDLERFWTVIDQGVEQVVERKSTKKHCEKEDGVGVSIVGGKFRTTEPSDG